MLSNFWALQLIIQTYYFDREKQTEYINNCVETIKHIIKSMYMQDKDITIK